MVLASQLRDAVVEGTATVLPPEGWTASPDTRPYRLEAGGHLRFPVELTPPAGVEPGLYFAAVRIAHDGQQVEDVATVAVGDLPELLPAAGAAPEAWTAAQGTTSAVGRDTGLTATVLTESVRLTPAAGPSSTSASPTAPGARSAASSNSSRPGAPGRPSAPRPRLHRPHRGRADRVLRPRRPRGRRPGTYWALAKVMWFGRCQYTRAVDVVVAP
ncbi:NEW3 domain-containing protein [Kitasatospora aburaviensis]